MKARAGQFTLCVIMLLLLCGCDKIIWHKTKENKDFSNHYMNVMNENIRFENLTNKEVDVELKKVVYEFYKKRQNSKLDQNIRIFAVKPYEDGCLIASDMVGGDGETAINLMLLRKDNDGYLYISKIAHGFEPISMGFSINRLIDGENTVLFGNFNDSTWVIDNDTRRVVSYSNILVKFQKQFNGSHEVIESVAGSKGYIIIAPTVSRVKQLILYNEKNEVEGSLVDLIKYGNDINDASFEQYIS